MKHVSNVHFYEYTQMVLAVLPMVELVEVAEGVFDGLEDRFPKIGVDIYTESFHKKFHEAGSKITTLCICNAPR